MRFSFTATLLIASVVAISAQTTVFAAPATDTGQKYDVPADSKPQSVIIGTRDLQPGESVGRHIHHGVELTYVGRGEMTVYVDGQPPHAYHAGESFQVPREIPHDAKNTGATVATLYVTYAIDKGTPPRVPVP